LAEEGRIAGKAEVAPATNIPVFTKDRRVIEKSEFMGEVSSIRIWREVYT
jgi:hypothetical protein